MGTHVCSAEPPLTTDCFRLRNPRTLPALPRCLQWGTPCRGSYPVAEQWQQQRHSQQLQQRQEQQLQQCKRQQRLLPSRSGNHCVPPSEWRDPQGVRQRRQVLMSSLRCTLQRLLACHDSVSTLQKCHGCPIVWP